ncbi:MAG: DMT family transporter, partial [Ktedonobacteraceae bacterium]
MKLVASLAFLLNTVLFATYYSVSKEALGRIDPIIFSFFEMTALVPLALCVLIISWRDMNRAVVKHGIFLGSWLFLALITIAIALKFTTATSTAFFPSLNGFLAAFIAWVFLRQPVKKLTWFAGVLSVLGTVLLVVYSSTGTLRGSLIAFLGGIFFTCYVFLADHQQKDNIASLPLLSIELLTMALWANLVVLLFGDWRVVHPALPHDLWVVLYVAIACTFLPTLITVLMQKHLSAVTISFIYILEPVLGAIIALFYLHELLPVQAYIGGLLVVAGAIIHTVGMSITRRPISVRSTGTLEENSNVFWQTQTHVGSVQAWNIQSHLHVGNMPYHKPQKREKALVQRRRLDRLQR